MATLSEGDGGVQGDAEVGTAYLFRDSAEEGYLLSYCGIWRLDTGVEEN